MKAAGGRNRTLKELADQFGAQAEYRNLLKEAQLGRQYRKELEKDVVRLCMTLELGAEYEVLRGIMKNAGEEDLKKLREALEKRAAEFLPATTQLNAGFDSKAAVESGFLI